MADITRWLEKLADFATTICDDAANSLENLEGIHSPKATEILIALRNITDNCKFSVNKGEDINYELLNWVGYHLEGTVLVVLGILGIFGNIMSMVVLTSPEMKSNFHRLLTFLAFFDLLFLLSAIFLFGLPNLFSEYVDVVLPRIMPIGYGLVHITRTGSVLATLCVTIERFFAIVYPLKMIKKTRFLIIISLFASVSYNIPRFFEFETKYDDDYAEGNDNPKYPSNHSKVVKFAPTKLRINQLYIQIYVVWMKCILVEVIPYVTILVLNIIIFRRMQHSVRVRKQLTPGTNICEITRREIRNATIFIWVVIVFILCQSVKIIPDLYEAFYCAHDEGNICKSTTTIEVVISISNVLTVFNSASNFVIYIWRGAKFRRILMGKLAKFVNCIIFNRKYGSDTSVRFDERTTNRSIHQKIPGIRLSDIHTHLNGLSESRILRRQSSNVAF